MMMIPLYRPELPPSWGDVRVLVTQAPFNVGNAVGDDPQQVAARRAALSQHLGAPIQWLHQVHGCTVVQAPVANPAEPIQADASVCTQPKQALAVLTADCLPVVLRMGGGSIQQATQAVAVVHAGWRGLCAGILQATAARLQSQTLAHAEAWLGPAIGPASFEVGADVVDAIGQVLQNPKQLATVCKPKHAQSNFQEPSPHESKKWQVDLYQLARLQLQALGCQAILGGGMDTYTDPRWYSHRHSQHQAAPQGRFATVVCLAPELTSPCMKEST